MNTYGLLGTMLVIGYLLFLFIPLYTSAQVSKKLIANTIAYQQHPANPTIRILVAGDSTAVGVGTTDNKYSTAGRLGTQYPDADITNIAVSGAVLKDAIVQLQSQQGKHYDLLLIQIGANDVTHLTSYNTVQQEVATVFTLTNELSTKTIVLTAGKMGISNLFHFPLSTIINSRSFAIRNIFINEAGKYNSIYYIDLYQDKKHDFAAQDPKRYYATDGFHLSDDGYGVWYSYIQKLL